MNAIKKQEKYSFAIKSGEHKGVYGPFDTTEAANKTRSALVAAGLTVGAVETLWTVSTARSIQSAVAPKPEAKKVEAPKPSASKRSTRKAS